MLILNRVVLQNFCQHEYLDLPLTAGLTGIFGPNGAGKTNLRHAVKGAFTGSFARHPDGVAGWIRQNQDGPCYVEVSGTLAGKEFRVRRDLTQSKIHHRLWYDDRMLAGAGEVESWFREVSGISTQVMAEFLFVSRKDMFDFLESPDTERSKKLAILCGTTEFESIRESYSQILKQDKLRFETIGTVSLELLLASLQEAEGNEQRLRNELEQLQQEARSSGTLEELERSLQKSERHTQYLEQTLEQLTNKIVESKKAHTWTEECAARSERQNKIIKECVAECHHSEEEQKKAENTLAEYLDGQTYEEVVLELKSIRGQMERRNHLAQNITRSEATLKGIQNVTPVDSEERKRLQQEHEQMGIAIANCDSRLNTLEILTDTLRRSQENATAGDCHCPVCGSDTENWTMDFMALERETVDLKNQKSEMIGQLQELTTDLENLTTRQTLYEKTVSRKQELERSLSEDRLELERIPFYDVDIDRELKHLENNRQAVQDTQTRVQHAQSRWKRENDILADISFRLETAAQEEMRIAQELALLHLERQPEMLQEIETLRPQIESLQRRCEEAREKERQITNLEGACQESIRQQKYLARQMEEQQRIQESAGEHSAWFEICDKAIHWLRKDGLPRLIHRSVLHRLTEIINRELAGFRHPFQVEVNDDLTFTALFEDGRRIHSKVLSNGQKIMLALSFWSAVNMTFAQNLGIMIFDEPADCLDRENTELFYEVMEQRKVLLHRRGQQVAIITLDEGMTDIFDTVYRIGDGDRAGRRHHDSRLVQAS